MQSCHPAPQAGKNTGLNSFLCQSGLARDQDVPDTNVREARDAGAAHGQGTRDFEKCLISELFPAHSDADSSRGYK